jgi:SSS family solute:Na+ symporter
LKERNLNAVQVGALLVSASYGIGFLFGSGEMALSHGMGGSIYGLATALGMLLLALFAARLWRAGVPIWDMFGKAYGSRVKNSVALLSVVWMAGVLAAQIHGGVAVVRLLGLGEVPAYALVLACIYGASKLNLRLASTVFSFFLLASALVLVYALISGSGGAIYLTSPSRLLADVPTFRLGTLISIVIAVVALVCTGADYHQFVFAARRPAVGAWGCLLAGVCLVAVSFLPASVVIALKENGTLVGLRDAKQVIPFALLHEASQFGAVVGSVLLLGLSAAALGSGAAIVRAMTSALHCATEGLSTATTPRLTLLALAIGGALAARGEGIIETMVSVNVIYIGSIAVTFVALLLGRTLSSTQAGSVMVAGFAGSFAVYLASLMGLSFRDGDLASLIVGVAASGVLYLGHAAFNSRPKQTT